MRSLARRAGVIFLGVFCALASSACSGDAGGGEGGGEDGGPCDIAARLSAVPGLTFNEGPSMAAGYRFFQMTFDQPEDHASTGGTRFQQHMTLLHRDCTAPTIVYNSGYFVSAKSALTELATLVSGNQISMEHRFFAASRPNPADWTKLDIVQAAA